LSARQFGSVTDAARDFSAWRSFFGSMTGFGGRAKVDPLIRRRYRVGRQEQCSRRDLDLSLNLRTIRKAD